MENRRHFTRILFSYEAALSYQGKEYSVNITDISLNGALVNLTTKNKIPLSSDCQLTINLSDGVNKIVMQVTAVHQHDDEVGLKCHHIDIESISHLRRLVELNLGDDEQLNKELSQLSSS